MHLDNHDAFTAGFVACAASYFIVRVIYALVTQ